MSARTVTACVLIIGNEILSGRTQDTNLNHITLTLGAWGIQVREARVIPDVPGVIIDTVNEVRERFDYVFTTGGIGPTHDDITADCIADAFGVKLVVNAEIAERIQRRPAPPDVMAARMRMARIPDGAVLIDNPVSIAPGFSLGNVHVMAGVPRIFEAMLAGVLSGIAHGKPLLSRSLRMLKGEGEIATSFAAFAALYPDLSMGSYPFNTNGAFGTNLVIRGTDADRLDAALLALQALLA